MQLLLPLFISMAGRSTSSTSFSQVLDISLVVNSLCSDHIPQQPMLLQNVLHVLWQRDLVREHGQLLQCCSLGMPTLANQLHLMHVHHQQLFNRNMVPSAF